MAFVRLVICVVGIYASFLSWALIQERLSTTPYEDPSGGKPKYFKSVIFLNTIQSGFSATAALIYLLLKKNSSQSILQVLGLTNPTTSKAEKTPKQPNSRLAPKDQNRLALLGRCLQCAILNSLGSPFGYASLKHIDYPTMILGKSCKLVPVMIMNIILYRRKFAIHKYIVVGMVTVGISLFMLFADHGSKASKGAQQSSLFGLTLLLINLLIDGATNSTQDEIFSRFTISGSQLMFIMNALATIITLAALQAPLPTAISSFFGTSNSSGNEFTVAIEFIKSYPKVLQDILLFSSAGAIGQLFIFETLSHFGSLTLVTITVTRKLFTMLLSVFFFDHKLSFGQWGGIAIVFGAIGLEAYVKMSGHGKANLIIDEKQKAKMKEL
ncbi:UDP-galactose transporter [Puccinia graminis f. sp. tritici]|uniref:UDP-galactose transporter homolog 1 n=1 Tax=Puccinia graminis f. sp. tritici TaxID=56615 RepID=A0A5B0MB78_PUCGR|nr:UDP-galactose transporter [Puccinia graminis f. sp. tritici]KAA1084825.1 UDP-galactose transporter [Puccinia graminis f. sp. tritici]